MRKKIGRRDLLTGDAIHRVVIKLGSSTLTHPRRGLREEVIGEIAEQVATLVESRSLSVIVVSSGAISSGRKVLGLTGRPSLAQKQAAAAVGQPVLMEAWSRALGRRGLRTGQVLLTHEDFADRRRYLNAKNTFETLLASGIVPIVNENDTVATAEIRLGDNDHLAALVAHLVGADLLVLMTDLDGLFTADPHRDPDAVRIPVLDRVDDAALGRAQGTRAGSPGTGGMSSKLQAARLASSLGVPVVITQGDLERRLEDVLAGEDVGTFVIPAAGVRPSGRKLWIAAAGRLRGTLTVDEGAARVLREDGRSLLPAGITAVSGDFRPGDVVAILDPEGQVVARGVSGWPADEVARAMGRRTADLGDLSERGLSPEVVHRDDLTLLPQDEHSTREGGAQ
jgi:glutamate 5-kinase